MLPGAAEWVLPEGGFGSCWPMAKGGAAFAGMPEGTFAFLGMGASALSWLARFGFGTCAEWGNSHAGSALGIPAFKSQPSSVSVQTSHLKFLNII